MQLFSTKTRQSIILCSIRYCTTLLNTYRHLYKFITMKTTKINLIWAHMTFFDSVRLKNEMIALYFLSEFGMKALYELVPHVNASNVSFSVTHTNWPHWMWQYHQTLQLCNALSLNGKEPILHNAITTQTQWAWNKSTKEVLLLKLRSLASIYGLIKQFTIHKMSDELMFK